MYRDRYDAGISCSQLLRKENVREFGVPIANPRAPCIKFRLVEEDIGAAGEVVGF